MNKNIIRTGIVIILFWIIFSLISFVLFFDSNSVFWCAYVCGVIAILYQAYILKASNMGEKRVKSRFYGFPIIRIGIVYLTTQLVVSIIEMAMKKIIPFKFVLIVNVLIIAFALVGSIVSNVVRDGIEHMDMKVKKDITNMRTLQENMSSLENLCKSESMKVIVHDINEKVRYSDPVSSEATVKFELQLQQDFGVLKAYVIQDDVDRAKELVDKMNRDLEERNVNCLLNKE